MQERERAYLFAKALCRESGEDEAFLQQFWERLEQEPDIYREFTAFMDEQTFLCQAKAGGATVIDIMVWQIDHFKADLDRGNEAMRNNKDKMILMAFDTMLRMRRDPAPYLEKMRSETGTDYPGKC